MSASSNEQKSNIDNESADKAPIHNRRNYYRLLFVQPDAPFEIIQASYRSLMQKLRYHPDLGGDDWNAAILNEAYGVLTNPKERAAYDQKAGFNNYTRREVHTPSRTQIITDPTTPFSDQLSGMQRQHCVFCRYRFSAKPEMSSAYRCPQCNSPTTGAKRPVVESNGRRILQRTRYHVALEFLATWPQYYPFHGTIYNFSPLGLGFSSPYRLSTHRLLKVSCVDLDAVARVVYCMPDSNTNTFSTGIEFITLKFHESHGMFVSESV